MKTSSKAILALVPRLCRKLSIYRGPAYRIAAAAYSAHGNLLGIEMNGWRELPTTRKGTGKHAEAALIKRFGVKLRGGKIYVLRVGNAGDILPIHPCSCCSSMASKAGVEIIPIHEMLGLY